MQERRQYGFRVRPNYGQVQGYIQERESMDLPKRNASVYMASHFYLDDFPLSDQMPTPRRPSRPSRASRPRRRQYAEGLAPPRDEVAPPPIIARPSKVDPLLERAGQRAALQEARAIQDIEAFTQGQMAEAGIIASLQRMRMINRVLFVQHDNIITAHEMTLSNNMA